MEYSPVILFVYNRPFHTKRLIESLSQNLLASESHLYIYSDASRNEQDKQAVKEVRQFIQSVSGFAEVTIIERKENWGLASNIIDGVTTLVNQYGRVIVLEDDLILAPYFLQFMNDALETYKNESSVGHIHACEFFESSELPDTFLVRWTGSWGWATWKDSWQLFDPDGKALLNELEKRNLTYEFDFNGAYKFTRMLKRQTLGQNDSWAIRWNASLFLKGILSLNAGKSLVQNKGFDGSGTNCGGGDLYSSALYSTSLCVKKVSPIVEDTNARHCIERYYKKTNSFRAKVVRRIKRVLKGDFGA